MFLYFYCIYVLHKQYILLFRFFSILKIGVYFGLPFATCFCHLTLFLRYIYINTDRSNSFILGIHYEYIISYPFSPWWTFRFFQMFCYYKGTSLYMSLCARVFLEQRFSKGVLLPLGHFGIPESIFGYCDFGGNTVVHRVGLGMLDVLQSQRRVILYPVQLLSVPQGTHL